MLTEVFPFLSHSQNFTTWQTNTAPFHMHFHKKPNWKPYVYGNSFYENSQFPWKIWFCCSIFIHVYFVFSRINEAEAVQLCCFFPIPFDDGEPVNQRQDDDSQQEWFRFLRKWRGPCYDSASKYQIQTEKFCDIPLCLLRTLILFFLLLFHCNALKISKLLVATFPCYKSQQQQNASILSEQQTYSFDGWIWMGFLYVYFFFSPSNFSKLRGLETGETEICSRLFIIVRYSLEMNIFLIETVIDLVLFKF